MTARGKRSDAAPLAPVTTILPKPQRTGIGTAFAINDRVEFLANYHVVKACAATLRLRISGEWQDGGAVAVDEDNDLAVLRPRFGGIPALRFREGMRVRPADSVLVLGFPYAGLLTITPQVTTGIVSVLSGIHDDARYVQLTAPVQPGSSGGPLLDSSGTVVGVVSAKLDILAAADGYRHRPGSRRCPKTSSSRARAKFVRKFLGANHIADETAQPTTKLYAVDIGEVASKSVVMVGCE